MYVTIVFSAIFFAKILLIIVNVFHKPREGNFLRHVSDKDYRYWSLRNTIKRWPVCEFGKDCVVGQGAIIQSAVIIGNLLIMRKTVVKDNVRIGSHAIVMPGTRIGHNCILAANSVTTVGQILENGWVYVGIPAKKFKKNYFFEDGLEDKLGHVKDVEALREKYEKIYTKRYDELTLKERRELKREKKEEEKKRWEPENPTK
jgi:carbonic anhydrase/acetyltransferase-like protein (isoleucine patch superfamily)